MPGLAAKPIIDIQISVAAFEPLEAFKHPLERLGYVYRADNPERTKRYFREPPGRPRTHVHVRRAGSFSEQWALLFRDYLRAHAEVAAEYAALKRRLAARFRDDRRAYLDAKGRFYGKSSAWPTGGRKPRDGTPAPATPDPRTAQRLRKRCAAGQVMMWQTRSGGQCSGSRVAARSASSAMRMLASLPS